MSDTEAKPTVSRARRGMRRVSGLDPSLRGMLWATAAGFCFANLNTIMRQMSIELPPIEAMFLRYSMGLAVMLPLVFQQGLGTFKTNTLRGQFARGLAHSLGLAFWFTALPMLPLSYTTALGFTGPIFIMLGAVLFLGERMLAARWLAALGGFVGVLIIVWPKMTGGADLTYSLIMMASAPMFAGSFLIAKVLTRHDKPSVIVAWQGLTVSLFAAPFAFWVWEWPTLIQWLWFALGGTLGSFGHWCLTRAYAVADISASQPVKFLDLVWASMLGFIVFGDIPTLNTLAGGAVIISVTIWIAQRSSSRR